MWAHSKNDLGERHDLVAHLRGVGELAAAFGTAFGAEDTARYLGLWHDVGKFNEEFQQYLLDCEQPGGAGHRGPDHKAAGAQLASEALGFCALAVQGHHGGLRSITDLRGWLEGRHAASDVARAIQLARQALPELAESPVPGALERVRHDRLGAELLLRMLFSALVDADYLDTERHFDTRRAETRGSSVGLDELWRRFERFHAGLPGDGSPVNEVRREVYEACIRAAGLPTGVFRLTVPTGGGKTLSGMAFALRHALRHGLDRVIVAVPFISITEQTADVYRSAFAGDNGRAAVLEHHSGVDDAESEGGAFDNAGVWRRLAAENWDAPIVVTTTVQLFESLFARGTSRGRKVHRLARSVIVLDEAQSLPAYLLQPILDALQGLARDYSTTVVLSTATQPAFEAIPAFAGVEAREIVPEPAPFFARLKRVEYDWRSDRAVGWDEVAEWMSAEPQALTIVNTKKDALALLDALNDPRAMHLSTLLCGAHRRAVLADVRRRLTGGRPCRLVSTQVVEAGVDVDFPLVLRALGPLDGVIQAAGRCNREGRLDVGRVIVFRPVGGGLPRGPYRIGAGVTESLLAAGSLDPDEPAQSHEYFRRLFGILGRQTDREGVQGLREAFDFPGVNSAFKMIEQETESAVITQYGAGPQRREVRRWLEELRAGTPRSAFVLRRLQPYLVPVARYTAERDRASGLIEPILPGVGEWLGGYDEVRGIQADQLGPESLVV